jgi:NDP-sugar pyrophosphorylase family protein
MRGPVRGMILAAGKGTRLRPLTESVPKALIEVAGQPMIAFPLRLLRAAGITEVVINLHHLGAQVRERLGNGDAYGVRLIYSEEDPILDTGGAVGAARAFLGGGTFAVVNADTYCELDLRAVIAWHRQRRALATLVLRPDPDALRRDDIGIDAAARIRRFLGRPFPPGDPGPRLMFAGIQVLETRIFEFMPPGVYSMTHDIYPRLLAAGEPLFGYVYDGYWRVLDTPADLAAGRREIPARLQAR